MNTTYSKPAFKAMLITLLKKEQAEVKKRISEYAVAREIMAPFHDKKLSGHMDRKLPANWKAYIRAGMYHLENKESGRQYLLAYSTEGFVFNFNRMDVFNSSYVSESDRMQWFVKMLQQGKEFNKLLSEFYNLHMAFELFKVAHLRIKTDKEQNMTMNNQVYYRLLAELQIPYNILREL